jgi:hypothetical protein
VCAGASKKFVIQAEFSQYPTQGFIMGLFICWSGTNSRSHQLAKILSERIPEILQNVDVFLSEQDIGPGTTWMEELRKALKENRFGILCVTPENKDNRWIHFEAGSLWKGEESTRVCPLLFKINKPEITGPLAQLQAVEFEKSQFFRLMDEVNTHGCEKAISPSLLQKSFDRVWSDLETDASKIEEPSTTPLKPRKVESMVEEILEIVRSLQGNRQTDPIISKAIQDAIAGLRPVAMPSFNQWVAEGGTIKPPSYPPRGSSDKAEEYPKEE